MKKELVNSIWMIIDKILVMVSGLLWMSILSRSLSLGEFGEYQYIVSFVSMLLPIVAMGLNGIANKEIIINEKNKVIVNIFAIKLAAAMMSFIIISICLYNDDEWYAWLIYSSVLFAYSFQVIESLNQSESKSIVTTKVRLASSIVFLLIKFFSFYNYDLTVYESLAIQAAEIWAYFICLLLATKINVHKCKNELCISYVKYIVPMGSVLILSGFAESLNLKLDQVLLKSLVGTEEVAVYSVAARLSEVWYFFPAAIVTSFLPRYIKVRNESLVLYYSLIRKTTFILILISFLITGGLFVFGEWLIDIIFGKDYSSSYSILMIHMLAMPLVFARAMFSKWLIIEGKLRYSLYSHLLGASVNLVLNLALIPAYGAVGAAIATVVSYSVSSFIFLFIFKDTRIYLKHVIFKKRKIEKNIA